MQIPTGLPGLTREELENLPRYRIGVIFDLTVTDETALLEAAFHRANMFGMAQGEALESASASVETAIGVLVRAVLENAPAGTVLGTTATRQIGPLTDEQKIREFPRPPALD